MKDNLFYLLLFIKHPWHYTKLWIEFGERPPREVLIVSDRDLTTEEKEYGLSLEDLATSVLGKSKGIAL